jgi:WXG100 family type VII secretion target
MANQVRAEYDALQDVASKFQQEADRIDKVLSSLKNQADGLQGKWVGQGAQQFQQEMQNSIYPAFGRMQKAMGAASDITNKIAGIFQKGEQEAKIIVTIKIS